MRGSSSTNFSKKSFAVTLKKPGGGDNSFPLLGMPADEDWVLYGGDEVRRLGVWG